ncbi:hypothetical protein RM543_17170 [Roseicyclus sp. F158]|uniref:Uncharacterized protein n=1 Tax=Tropicimonas omnivorans TaxID=3075590 RepID=A0ABU3DL27_9RHOB|nr:hypothetical protein [Roseicyclus sp. F158]MDT0684415.1 hypothetical protein [Roseicyclus sp. F158]
MTLKNRPRTGVLLGERKSHIAEAEASSAAATSTPAPKSAGTMGSNAMTVLSTHIVHARRDRDFGRVEAMVRLIVRDAADARPQVVHRRVSVPARSESLRDDIAREAAMMAQLDQLAHTRVHVETQAPLAA